jgi:hypothetical protein
MEPDLNQLTPDEAFRHGIYKALCGNGLTHDVADFLSKLAMDIFELRERIIRLESKSST